jgi:hypothetical protein
VWSWDRGDKTSPHHGSQQACRTEWLSDEGGKRLSPQQAASSCSILLFAGHETTMGILGNCLRR